MSAAPRVVFWCQSVLRFQGRRAPRNPYRNSEKRNAKKTGWGKGQGPTRLGATGLRASEREICLWEGLWEDLWKISENLWEPLKTSKDLWKPLKALWKPLRTLPLRDPLRDAPNCVAPWTLSEGCQTEMRAPSREVWRKLAKFILHGANQQ